jgi:hypothetical protein
MSLSDLASVGSVVSGVAVLVSLVYLALQVRQAEKNQRGLMQEARASRLADALFRLAAPDLAPLFRQGLAGEDLSATEIMRFRWIFRAQLAGLEDSFFQHQRGLLTEEAFESSRLSISNFMAAPGARVMWDMTRNIYAHRFQAYVDEIVRATPVRPMADESPIWKTAIAAQLGAVAR